MPRLVKRAPDSVGNRAWLCLNIKKGEYISLNDDDVLIKFANSANGDIHRIKISAPKDMRIERFCLQDAKPLSKGL